MFELVVPRRTGVNMMLDTTIQKEGIGVSLLCEDQVGGLSVIKLLRVEEGGELKPLVWVQLRGGGGEKGHHLPPVLAGLDHQEQLAQRQHHGHHVEGPDGEGVGHWGAGQEQDVS